MGILPLFAGVETWLHGAIVSDFLDEATSAVTETTEAHLCSLLRQRLPTATLLSVGRRSTLRPFHARQMLIQPDGAGPASLVELRVGSPESALTRKV